MDEHLGNVGFGRQVDEGADRFAITAAARQLAAIQGEEAAVGRQHHQPVGGLGVNPETVLIAFAVFDGVVFFLMPFERAQP
jgi:hypothetical protein